MMIKAFIKSFLDNGKAKNVTIQYKENKIKEVYCHSYFGNEVHPVPNLKIQVGACTSCSNTGLYGRSPFKLEDKWR